jgi:hypothetical protein
MEGCLLSKLRPVDPVLYAGSRRADQVQRDPSIVHAHPSTQLGTKDAGQLRTGSFPASALLHILGGVWAPARPGSRPIWPPTGWWGGVIQLSAVVRRYLGPGSDLASCIMACHVSSRAGRFLLGVLRYEYCCSSSPAPLLHTRCTFTNIRLVPTVPTYFRDSISRLQLSGN